VRITGGTARGRRLTCPKGKKVRPTSDMVRQAMFNILDAGYIYSWPQIKVIDLFAGTGALGIEALSRGAQSCIFVEREREALSNLKRNLSAVADLEAEIKIAPQDVYSFLGQPPRGKPPYLANLVLADPPYGKGHLEGLLKVLSSDKFWIDRDAIVVVEESSAESLDPERYGFQLDQKRGYGNTALFFLERKSS